MYRNKKVIVCSPVGRKRYLEILSQYVLAQRPLVDQWHLWFNTVNRDDAAYIYQLADSHPDFVTIRRDAMPNSGVTPGAQGSTVQHFYHYCTNPDTIYVKVDDDIVYIDKNCFRHLIDCKLKYPDSLFILANTINNAICTHLHQRCGGVPLDFGIVGWRAGDDLGWKSPEYALKIHQHFLKNVYNQSQFVFSDFILFDYIRYSINVMAWAGEDMVHYKDAKGDDEHHFTVDLPAYLKRPNVICGSALASHFAYFTQRAYLDEHNILDEYRQLASTIATIRPIRCSTSRYAELI